MYQWRRGSTFNLGLRVKSGTVTGTETISCWLKRAANGKSPGDGTEPAVVLQPTFQAAVGDAPAYWLFTGTAEQSLALQIGQYVADARIEIGGGVIQTETVLIEILERVTEGA